MATPNEFQMLVTISQTLTPKAINCGSHSHRGMLCMQLQQQFVQAHAVHKTQVKLFSKYRHLVKELLSMPPDTADWCRRRWRKLTVLEANGSVMLPVTSAVILNPCEGCRKPAVAVI